jgi:predicted AAA+ superfamily ATPase
MERDLLKLLNARLSENETCPVLLKGVHGCGKTTLGAMFAKRFAQSMAFDLSKAPDRQAFANIQNGGMHFSDLYLHRSRDPRSGRTLLFIDDVHAAPEIWHALTGLANRPHNLFILGATDVGNGGRRTEDGSRRSAVGRRRTAVGGRRTAGGLPPYPPEGGETNPSNPICTSWGVSPLSFPEFLSATGETEALASYREVPCPDHAHNKLLALFHRYVMVGGMPGAVTAWTEGHSMVLVEKAFDRILAGWDELLRQEVAGRKSATLAASLLVDAFPYASSRISFRGFGNRPVRSREAAQAFRSLESLRFLELVYPVTATDAGALPDTGRAPRLQFADTGMVIHLSGIRHLVSGTTDLTQLVGGQVLRHVAGQEIRTADGGRQTALFSRQSAVGSRFPKGGVLPPYPPEGGKIKSPLGDLGAVNFPQTFWVREKPQSKAEVDFVIRYDNLLVPVVARSGEPGRLRALHTFIDAAPHPYAVRLCADRLSVRKAETIAGKPFYLLSLPYYLAGRIREHLDGFLRFVG